jgi:hypothetical protein
MVIVLVLLKVAFKAALPKVMAKPDVFTSVVPLAQFNVTEPEIPAAFNAVKAADRDA